jgi:large subunit ribosomal protein L5
MAQAIPRLKQKFQDEILPQLQKELELENPMAVPKLTKIVVNAGIGKEQKTNSNVAEEFGADIAIITGQKPIVTKSKLAISNFKLREGMDSGLKVTLRGDRMWHFFDRLVNGALPRVKDFRGVSRKAFDGKGNYSLGIREHTVFPEIDTSQMVRIRSMQVIVCTSTENDEHAIALLLKLGMPLREK